MRKRKISFLLAALLVLQAIGLSPAAAAGAGITKYTYEVKPIISPYYRFIYVKTDNPRPDSFSLRDPESIYSSDGEEPQFRLSKYVYPDVKYENPAAYRVKGGYIFEAWDNPDGGPLILWDNSTKTDTGIRVQCPRLKQSADIAIDMFVKPEMTFFEMLDAIQAGLRKYAIYPRPVYDTSRRSSTKPWPYLASSPYAELTLNDHYSMFEKVNGMLLQKAYPFVLDSLSFPGTMATAAKKLQPDCMFTGGGVHWRVGISYKGETRIYGGAGMSGRDPIGTNRLEQIFSFDDTASDWNTSGTVDSFNEKLSGFREIAESDIAPYRDLVAGDTFQNTIRETNGTWVLVGRELFYDNPAYMISRSECGFTYLIPRTEGAPAHIRNAWVDGRYIGDKENIFILGERFEDHPQASIVLHNVHYTDSQGEEHCGDVVYGYREESDCWESWIQGQDHVTDELRLTKEQVAQMSLDCNTFKFPSSGLRYDGAVESGTPFQCCTVKYVLNNGKSGSDGEKYGFYLLNESAALPGMGSSDGICFDGWEIDGIIYRRGDLYTPQKESVTASAVFSPIQAATINRENFPDESFREYVAGFDTDGDGILSGKEISKITEIMCINKAISSLKGIEHFVNLYKLSCGGNNLTELDLSRNLNLMSLNCNNNHLKKLNISYNTYLDWLNCSSNELTELDLSHNPGLNTLYCSENRLNSLDVSNNPGLSRLGCQYNNLSILDLTHNTKIWELNIEKNKIDTFDPGVLPELTEFSCSSNLLGALDFSSNPKLTFVSCSNNNLETLDVSKNLSLGCVDCSANQLKTLDLSSNKALSTLYCSSNQLESLDLSSQRDLCTLYCDHNPLAEIDISNSDILCGFVRDLTRHKKYLNPYEVFEEESGNIRIQIDPEDRIIAGDVISESMEKNEEDRENEGNEENPDDESGEGNREDEGNEDNASDESHEEDREDEGNEEDRENEDKKERLPGDVNEDGEVDGRDVLRLMKYLSKEMNEETGEAVEISESNADVNQDGMVDELDLLRLMQYFAGQPVILE